MALVPYAAGLHFIPATFISPIRKIFPSTTSTYVYSKPVTASYSCKAKFIQRQPKDVNVDNCTSLAQSPSFNKPQVADGDQILHQKRTHFTVYQRGELEKTFIQSQYISPLKRRALSQKLGIPEDIIQTWFKNRRVKWRKEQRKRQTGASRPTASAPAGLYCHYFGHVPYPSSKLMLTDARILHGPAAVRAQSKNVRH